MILGGIMVLKPEPSSMAPGESPFTSSSESRLLEQIRRGSRGAAEVLFNRYGSWLRRWTRGRLPQRARGSLDTSDVVQEALGYMFTRLDWFESKRASALRAYLRRVTENRIRDELRRVTRRRHAIAPEQPVRMSEDGAPQLRRLVDDEAWRRYVDGLQRLSSRDRRLIAGRVELGYNYRQLALVERMPSPDAARMALRRALIRLGDVMADG
ncbi:MAG: RNA polymerase sigma factor [Acidobacteria bacterium]|nr:RNA polymerase sigma factor [Acidobacteriota bacterium]